ncbi:response regulator transcription factor [Saliterribacillus persicus]|uniref:Two-component system response regulator YesN n=1 Tax=Saliterribacillus persicus TaxID=930114 RepID=A0A368YFA5_9BACI|nr:response regulator [Saliterribacillus persicus]RCW77547.1 two-component system response regulator YesN [Saliterribacillus persicus]
MIKVLIVEDDQLVRKGLVSAMPWNEFNMMVVGEASNGQKALDFLRNNKVDLVITDLNMPKMSGLEFMRITNDLYSNVFIAVLTLHQDFEYIQEALRLGAIDFITKVQLEKENFHNVLRRLEDRINKELPHFKNSNNQKWTYETGKVLAIFSSESEVSPHSINKITNECEVQQVNDQIIICVPSEKVTVEEITENLIEVVRYKEAWHLVLIDGVEGAFPSVVHRCLEEYHGKLLFYDIRENEYLYQKSLKEIERINQNSRINLSSIRNRIYDFKWVLDDDLYGQLLSIIYEQHFVKEDLYNLMVEMVERWNDKYSFVMTFQLDSPNEFSNWQELKGWLDRFRFHSNFQSKHLYATDVMKSIWLALDMMQSNMQEAWTADYIAKEVNMSRSYFNKCFKEIVGKSFNHYLREIRLEYAKELLLHTNESIYWIAEKIGYMDEKYFSKLFKDYTGQLPSVFRKNGEM